MPHDASTAADRIVITGRTRLLGIVGDPIAQVRSPEVYNPRLARAGHDVVLLPMRVRAADFDATMRGLMALANLDGLVITYPHKERALHLLDEVGAVGRQVGAVNAMRRDPDGRWIGDMFDGAGLLRAVADIGVPVPGARVLLIGAGGAGRAIAVSLAAAGAAGLCIVDIDSGRADALASQLRTAFPSCDARSGPPHLDGITLLVNASPVGMNAGDGLPVPLDGLASSVGVVDIVPKPEVTPLLALAAARGCRHAGGKTMIAGQADAVLEFLGFV